MQRTPPSHIIPEWLRKHLEDEGIHFLPDDATDEEIESYLSEFWNERMKSGQIKCECSSTINKVVRDLFKP